MPDTPIDFAYGDYEDPSSEVAFRRVLNCHAETTPGRNTKTIVRANEGFQFPTAVSGLFQCSVVSNGINYCVIREPGGQDKLYTYSANTTSTTMIFLANLGATGGADQSTLRAATNGKNLVFVDNIVSSGNDYTYDISTTTVTQLSTVANYVSGVTDVIQKDGYYLFIAGSVLFHGDNSISGGGSGLVFNALSIQTLPNGDVQGKALVVANSVIYALTLTGTYLYQVASTTPFSFSVAQNTFINIAAFISTAVITDGKRIFLRGSADNGPYGYYMIEGTSYQLLSDEPTIEITSGPNFYNYRLNSHQFYGFTGQGPNDGDPFFEASRTYDLTESRLRGYPVWHTRDYIQTSDGELSYDYPIVHYQSASRLLMAFGYSEDSAETSLVLVDQASCLNEASFFGITQSVERHFEFTFPYIRNDSKPFTIKSVSLMFNGNAKEVELFQTTDGVNYVSLGEIDISGNTSNVGEWRRIGRFEADVSFKIRFAPTTDTDPLVIIGGFFRV